MGANWDKAENLKNEVKENNRIYGTLAKLEAQKLEAQKPEAQKHNRQESLHSSKVNGGEKLGNNPTPPPQKRIPPTIPPKPPAFSLATGIFQAHVEKIKKQLLTIDSRQ